MSFAHSFIVDTKTFVDENEKGYVLYETVYDILTIQINIRSFVQFCDRR